MKKSNPLLYILVFWSFLFFGFWSGRNASALANDGSKKPNSSRSSLFSGWIDFNSPKESFPLPEASQNNKTASQTVFTPNSQSPTQQNLLIIQVDDLEQAQPKLIHIWMLITIKDSPRLIWMPVFPAYPNNDDPLASDKDLSENFQLSGDHALSDRFKTVLFQRNLLWDHYAIYDQTTLEQLNQSTGLFRLTGGSDLVGSLTSVRQICQVISQDPNVVRFELFKPLLGRYLLTDLDLETGLKDWQTTLGQVGNPVCDFPFLEQH